MQIEATEGTVLSQKAETDVVDPITLAVKKMTDAELVSALQSSTSKVAHLWPSRRI